MNKEELRYMTYNTVKESMDTLVENYMELYDEYYNDYTDDGAVLKNLVDAIIGINAVVEVYRKL